MPLQNRVTPEGEIVAVAARGTMMGNRGGALHDADRRLGRRRWVSRQWICCRLSFNGRRRQVMVPGRYTELFFLDEATAFAAGHRPCFECRRADALRFAAMWSAARGEPTRATAQAMDAVLHRERVDSRGRKVAHSAPWAELPPGAIVRHGHEPHLVLTDRLMAWSPEGYGGAVPRPSRGEAVLLTPPSIVAVMRAGYAPTLHESAASAP